MSSYEWRERAHREGRSTSLDGIPRWALALIDRYHHTTTYPEPPRDSGEADAVNGLTALGTHDGPATAGSSNAPRRLEATGSRAGDNTLERSNAGHDARS